MPPYGPPPNAAPYFYMTDADLSIMHGEDKRKVITTIERPNVDNVSLANTLNKRVSTSPLKSCIQGAEVKIARGGVAVSFEPWKSEGKPTKKKVSN